MLHFQNTVATLQENERSVSFRHFQFRLVHHGVQYDQTVYSQPAHNALLIFGTDLWFLLALTSIAPFVTASPLSGLFTHWIPRATIVKHWPGAAVVNYIHVICLPRGPFCEKLRAQFLPIQTDLDRQITPVFIFCFGIVDTVKGPVTCSTYELFQFSATMGWNSIKSNVSQVIFLLKLDFIENSQYKTCSWNLLVSWFTMYLLVPLQSPMTTQVSHFPNI